MRAGVKRVEVARIRVCGRCGRGGAELRTADGEQLVVPLDAIRARQLSATEEPGDVRSLTEVILATFAMADVVVGEVVLDVSDGRLAALVSLDGGEHPEVVACTAEEGVALVVRGGVKLYATDEALAHGSPRPQKPAPETVH